MCARKAETEILARCRIPVEGKQRKFLPTHTLMYSFKSFSSIFILVTILIQEIIILFIIINTRDNYNNTRDNYKTNLYKIYEN